MSFRTEQHLHQGLVSFKVSVCPFLGKKVLHLKGLIWRCPPFERLSTPRPISQERTRKVEIRNLEWPVQSEWHLAVDSDPVISIFRSMQIGVLLHPYFGWMNTLLSDDMQVSSLLSFAKIRNFTQLLLLGHCVCTSWEREKHSNIPFANNLILTSCRNSLLQPI